MGARALAGRLALLGLLANVLLFSLLALYPFEFSLDPAVQHRHERVIERNWLDFEYLFENSFRTDLLRNVFVLLPFGACWTAWRRLRRPSPGRSPVPSALVAGFLLSALVEGLQLFIPGRFFQLSDIAMNTLGAAAGGAVVSALLRLLAPGADGQGSPRP